MLCIYHESTDPYFNVATDEYILKHLDEDCFMLWRNDKAIIVGQYQNTLAEINYGYVKEHQIAVVRRLSGGGAVYHDLGNLNFSFTRQGKDANLSDFELFTRPVVQVLQSLGADARFEGRNDLVIDGRKIAGNAAHIHHHKILHHGCLLFASQMRDVSEALHINPVKYTDRAIKSVPKRVTNISDHLKEPVSLGAFTEKLMAHVLATFPGARPYSFSQEDQRQIQKLRDEKYATHEWNFGRSPAYNYKKAVRTRGGLLEMNLEVKNGIIEQARIFGDFFSEKGITEVEEALIHTRHEEGALRSTLSLLPLEQHFRHIDLEELMAALF